MPPSDQARLLTQSRGRLYRYCASQAQASLFSRLTVLFCDLSTKILDIPSWVPDWSTPLSTNYRREFDWRADGFLSVQAKFMEKTCTVSGSPLAKTFAVYTYPYDEPVFIPTASDNTKLLYLLYALLPSHKDVL